MAFVVSRKEVGYFGYLCDRKLILFNSPFSESHEAPINLTIPAVDVAITNGVGEKTSDAEPLSSKPNKKHELHCAAISNCGTLIAISDDNKRLHLWRYDNHWSLVSTRSVPRKCLQILFTNSGTHIIAVDRGGDVFSFRVNEADRCAKLILGHVCAILDLTMTDDDEFIITCDRDGKIRVSCYPNTYNIATYCLGHREFVSTVKLYSSVEKLLLSGSGDGTLRLWRYDEGKEILCCDLTRNADLDSNNSSSEGICVSSSNVCEADSSGQNIASAVDNASVNPQVETQVGVKSIKYCSETQVFAMLFYTHAQIALFQVSSVAGGREVRFVQHLKFESVPQDAFFDDSGCLWVLLPAKDDCVAIFRSTQGDGDVRFVKLRNDESCKVEKICSEIGRNWQACSAVDVNNLYKQSYIGGFGSGEQRPSKDDSSEPERKKNKVK